MKRTNLFSTLLFVGLCIISFTDLQAKDNSKYYQDIIFQEGGDFLGLSFGQSMDSVRMMLPSDALDEDDPNYLYYYWKLDNNEFYLDLYFENDKLNSIDGRVYFFNKKKEKDKTEADNFYEDLVHAFTEAYGSEREEKSSGLKYTYWYEDDLDAEVGTESNEVYWYLYDYSYGEDWGYEDVEATPLHLEDLSITKDAFYGIRIGDSRVKVKAAIDEKHFYDSGLNDLTYNFEEGTNTVSLSFSFDKEDKVSLIDGYIDFPYAYYYYDYDSEEEGQDERENFYQELRKMLLENYGERKEKALTDGRRLSTWRFDGKELILITDDYSVYFIYTIDE